MRRSFEQVVCAVVFCVLTFCYLYNYQADVLVVTQFLASGGQTHYAPFLGAVIITSVLLFLQVVVQFFARLRRRSYALTYAPSLLLLAWLTGIRSDVTTQVDFGSWWLAIPFLLLVIVPAIIQAMRYQPYEPDERRQGFLSQLLWINLGTLALMFLFVGFLSNNDREFHKRARMEYLVDQRRYREALVMAQRLERPDSVSSMLTIYSVARTGHLTDSLFHYRLVGEGKVMRPSPQVHSLLTPRLHTQPRHQQERQLSVDGLFARPRPADFLRLSAAVLQDQCAYAALLCRGMAALPSVAGRNASQAL